MAVPAGLIRELPESSLAALSKNILPEGYGSPKGLVWVSAGKRKEFRLESGGTWKMQGSGQECPEVRGYLSRLVALRVAKWVGAVGKAEFLKPELEILVESEAGQKTKLVLGRVGPDGSAPLRIEGVDQAGLLGKEGVLQLKNSPELPSVGEGSPATQR